MLHLTDSGKIYFLNNLLSQIHIYCHLYVSPVNWAEDPPISDIVEASWPDYRPQAVAYWSPAVIRPPLASSWSDWLLWVRGTGGMAAQVYGYYYTAGPAGLLLGGEARPQGPVPMMAATDRVQVVPSLSLGELA